MHSLGFKASSSKNSGEKQAKIQLNESDKLNGNNEVESVLGAGATAPEQKDVVHRRQKPVSAAAKQPAARASMSSIIKGSVMDKVTLFGVTMGNTNNKEAKVQAAAPAIPTSVAKGNAEPSEANVKGPAPAGINIPKGTPNKRFARCFINSTFRSCGQWTCQI